MEDMEINSKSNKDPKSLKPLIPHKTPFSEENDSFESSASDNEKEETDVKLIQPRKEPISMNNEENSIRVELNEAKLILEYSKKNYSKIIQSTHEAIRYHYTELLKSQSTSRMLQAVLELTDESILFEINSIINGSLRQLLTNVYSNYFCQKLFERLDQERKISFLKIIFQNLTEIACDRTGTFSIQKILERISSNEECFQFIVKELQKVSLNDLDIIFKVNIFYYKF